MNPQHNAVLNNLGIIGKLALRCWRQLPPWVACSVSVEDLIQEISLHVLRVAGRYDPTRGRSSTFVWTVAQNYCRTFAQRYTARMRAGIELSLEPDSLPPCAESRVLESKQAVERLIEFLSPESRRFLYFLLYPSVRDYRRVKLSETVRAEIRTVAHRNGVRCDDLRTVLRCITAG